MTVIFDIFILFFILWYPKLNELNTDINFNSVIMLIHYNDPKSQHAIITKKIEDPIIMIHLLSLNQNWISVNFMTILIQK